MVGNAFDKEECTWEFLQKVFDDPEEHSKLLIAVEDLDLDTYGALLYEAKHQLRTTTIKNIRGELVSPYAEVRPEKGWRFPDSTLGSLVLSGAPPYDPCLLEPILLNRNWAAERTLMLRRTSKKVKEIVDKMRPSAVVCLNRIFWDDADVGRLQLHEQHPSILRPLMDGCRSSSCARKKAKANFCTACCDAG